MFSVSLIYVVISLLLIVVGLINRNMVPAGADYLFYVLIGIVSLKTMIGNREFSFPRYYIAIICTLLAVILLNAFVSPYSPGLIYIAIAVVVTMIPFAVFLLSYNIRFTKKEINAFIDLIILVACVLSCLIYVENILTSPSKIDSIMASDIFMIGFIASLCSQSIILSLARYHVTRRKRYIYAILFFIVTILLLNQLKAIAGSMIAIVAYLFFMTRMSKGLKVVVLAAGVAVFSTWIALSGSLMVEKLAKYTEQIVDEEAGDGIARIALYVQSVEMAKDFFPLGTGPGTYGSIPVNLIYSDVYYDYELADIWGLAPNSRMNFKMDTHWASVLGEMGVLGLMIYLVLLTYPVTALTAHWRRRRDRVSDDSPDDRAYLFYVSCGTVVMMVESFVLALPGRSSFIILYAGLTALMVRNLYTSESLLEHEDAAEDGDSNEEGVY